LSEDASIPGVVTKASKEGFERLLFAPTFLIAEVFSILLPGVLFILLLLAKSNHAVVAAFQTNLLGYKTRIIVALISAYLLGTVFAIPSQLIFKLQLWIWGKRYRDTQSPHFRDGLNKFLLGAFVLPRLIGTEHTLEYMVLAAMLPAFHVTTGVALICASFFPGDGFRWLEAAFGSVFFLRGYATWDKTVGHGVVLFGVSFSETIPKIFPGVEFSKLYPAILNFLSGQKIAISTQPIAQAASSSPDSVTQPPQSPS
jgi:hypothetical protein